MPSRFTCGIEGNVIMRFDCDATGAWLVDPRELSQRLGITTGHLVSQMRRGLVTSRVEPGRGDDEGRSRVTVRAGELGWQGVFDRHGGLISESSTSP